MKSLWKSKDGIEEELEEEKLEKRKEDVKRAREDNLIQDTEVLAEMVMASMMDSMVLAEEVMKLKQEIEELKNGGK